MEFQQGPRGGPRIKNHEWVSPFRFEFPAADRIPQIQTLGISAERNCVKRHLNTNDYRKQATGSGLAYEPDYTREKQGNKYMCVRVCVCTIAFV